MYDKFRQIINEKGITTYRVAKETNLSPTVFSDWKSGKSKPKVDKLQKIATYLGVKIEDLIE
ncbi:MAG: family transcriptional regulator [Herbinix sp.]|nr:family transcriptional regulator [Herbinix sp.]